MHNNQIEFFIDQRIANEVERLKRKKNYAFKQNPKEGNNDDDDDDDVHGHIQYTDIEHLKEFKQVRVGFEGKQLSLWSSAIYYFIIKYFNYPLEPVRIEFPKQFRHQYIIPNTGVYCHPEWSQKYWQKSMTLEQIINRVIQTFHEIPTYSDYPVDLSFMQLCLDKVEYQEVIKANKECATNYNNKIQEERQYFEKKKMLEQQQQNPKNNKNNEEQQQQQQQQQQVQQQKELIQNKQIIQEQQQEYQKNLKMNQQPQQNQGQMQQQQFNDQIHQLQNKNQNPQNYNQSVPQQIHQQQSYQPQNYGGNPDQQQYNYNQYQAQNNQQIPQFQQQPMQQEQNQPIQNNIIPINNQLVSNNPKIKIIGNVKQ